MKEIVLTQRKVALVDDWRFEELDKFNWQAVKMQNLWYAHTVLRLPDGSKFPCAMHWAVLKLKPPKGLVVDHKDGNGLNNQEENLEIVYRRQNAQNKHREYSSKYPGVSLQKSTGKWIAHIKIGKSVKHLGSFKTEEEAFLAYKHAVAICGQNVNFRKGGEDKIPARKGNS